MGKNDALEEKVLTKAKEPQFYKYQIVAAKKYFNRKDVCNVVLKDDEKYTMNEVDKLIEKFMSKAVK